MTELIAGAQQRVANCGALRVAEQGLGDQAEAEHGIVVGREDQVLFSLRRLPVTGGSGSSRAWKEALP